MDAANTRAPTTAVSVASKVTFSSNTLCAQKWLAIVRRCRGAGAFSAMPLESASRAFTEKVIAALGDFANGDEQVNQGNIILLNGTSSSGKTLISKTLQEILDGYYIHTGLDHYLERVPKKFHVISSMIAPPVAEGFLWLMGNDGCVTEIRIGTVGLRLLKGMYQAIAALASAGNNLIIDDVIFDSRVLREAVYSLCSSNAWFVGVRCPLQIAEHREKERGDRRMGLVKAHYDLVHRHGIYDFEVDTSVSSVMDCALQIKQRLEDRATPTAFVQLKRILASE